MTTPSTPPSPRQVRTDGGGWGDPLQPGCLPVPASQLSWRCRLAVCCTFRLAHFSCTLDTCPPALCRRPVQARHPADGPQERGVRWGSCRFDSLKSRLPPLLAPQLLLPGVCSAVRACNISAALTLPPPTPAPPQLRPVVVGAARGLPALRLRRRPDLRVGRQGHHAEQPGACCRGGGQGGAGCL